MTKPVFKSTMTNIFRLLGREFDPAWLDDRIVQTLPRPERLRFAEIAVALAGQDAVSRLTSAGMAILPKRYARQSFRIETYPIRTGRTVLKLTVCAGPIHRCRRHGRLRRPLRLRDCDASPAGCHRATAPSRRRQGRSGTRLRAKSR